MAIGGTRCYLVCYDIADPRRLGKVHRRVSVHALQVQYSVYLYHGSLAGLNELLESLENLIHPGRDDVRVYPVPTEIDLESGGLSWLDEETFLLGEDVVGF